MTWAKPLPRLSRSTAAPLVSRAGSQAHRPRTCACGFLRPHGRHPRSAAASPAGSVRRSHGRWDRVEEVAAAGDHQGRRDDPGQRIGRVVGQIRLDGGDVVRSVVGFLHQALAEELHQALAEPPEVHVGGDVGLGLGRPAVRGLVAGRLQQRLGVLPQPAAGIAQDQPANQLAVVGREVLGDLTAGREADDVDRPVEPAFHPAGVVVGHVTSGVAGRRAWASCHLVDGVVARVALVRPPKQPQGTPGRRLVLKGQAFQDDQRSRATGDTGVWQLDPGLTRRHLDHLPPGGSRIVSLTSTALPPAHGPPVSPATGSWVESPCA
jgi:hypothetical protein